MTLVDGRRHDFWRVDEARLRAALSAAPHLVTGCLVDCPSVRALGRTRTSVTSGRGASMVRVVSRLPRFVLTFTNF